MGPLDAPPEQLAALEAGRAFVDLSALREDPGHRARRAGLAPRPRDHRRGIPRPWAGATFPAARPPPEGSGPTSWWDATRRGSCCCSIPNSAGSIGDLLLALRAVVGRRPCVDRTQQLSVFGLVGHAAVVAARAGLEPSILGEGEDIVVREREARRQGTRAPGGLRSRRGRLGCPGGVADPPWAAPDGTGLRRGLPAVRSRSRCHDRRHQGVLPRPGIGGQGPQPRPPPRVLCPAGRRTSVAARARSWSQTAHRRPASSRAPRWPATAPARPRSSASDGRRRPPICAPPTASIWSPSARWTSPFVSFPVPLPGKEGLRAFDPFRWATAPLL